MATKNLRSFPGPDDPTLPTLPGLPPIPFPDDEPVDGGWWEF